MAPNSSSLGNLFVLVQANIDATQCISQGDEGDACWVTKQVFRNNLSYSTMIEEIGLAGYTALKHQEYLYNHAPLPSAFEQADEATFFVAGHLRNDERRRISTMKNVAPWEEHVSDVPTSCNVLKNIAGSMISGFEQGDHGIEATSPLLNKLQQGNVIVELRQASDSRDFAEAMHSTLSLFAKVAEQQGIDTIICQVPLKAGYGSRMMTVSSLSAIFSQVHLPNVDTVTCLSKHLVAHVSGSDPDLIPVFTDQFSHCSSMSEQDNAICFRVHPDSMTVYRFCRENGEGAVAEQDDAAFVVEFTVPCTDEIEKMTRGLSNQMDYVVHNVRERESRSADLVGGIAMEQAFFRTLGGLCGDRLGSFAAPVSVDAPFHKSDSTKTAPRNTSATALAPLAADAGATFHKSSGAAEQQFLSSGRLELQKKLAAACMKADLAADAHAAVRAKMELELKQTKAQLAHYMNLHSDKTNALHACTEDVGALKKFSQSHRNDHAMVGLAKEQLAKSRNQIQSMKREMIMMQSKTVDASKSAKPAASVVAVAAAPIVQIPNSATSPPAAGGAANPVDDPANAAEATNPTVPTASAPSRAHVLAATGARNAKIALLKRHGFKRRI